MLCIALSGFCIKECLPGRWQGVINGLDGRRDGKCYTKFRLELQNMSGPTRASVCINTRAIARLHVNAQAIHESNYMSVLACLCTLLCINKDTSSKRYESEDALVVDSSRVLQHMSELIDCSAVNYVN